MPDAGRRDVCPMIFTPSVIQFISAEAKSFEERYHIESSGMNVVTKKTKSDGPEI